MDSYYLKNVQYRAISVLHFALFLYFNFDGATEENWVILGHEINNSMRTAAANFDQYTAFGVSVYP